MNWKHEDVMTLLDAYGRLAGGIPETGDTVTGLHPNHTGTVAGVCGGVARVEWNTGPDRPYTWEHIANLTTTTTQKR